jgi:hypothetical protein
MYKRLLLVLVGFSLLAGCGGGSGSTVSLPSTYTGNTAQAAVTTSNAKTLSSNAYSGYQAAASINVLREINNNNYDQSPLLLDVVSTLDSSVSTIVQEPKTASKTVKAATTVQNTIPGYSGSFSYTISVDTTSGATSGTLSYSQYKSSSTSITMAGTVTFDGVFNISTSSFTSLSMFFNNVTATSGSVSINMNGSFAESISGSTKTYTMTIAVTDNVSNSTTLLKDYTLTLTGSSLNITGTYYNPTHGYVVITTVTPLTVSALSAMPTSGQLLCTGSNGTKARLTFASSGYTVEADTAGNGTFVVVP